MMAKRAIKKGDEVKLIRTGQRGVVQEITANGRAKVQLPSGVVVVEKIELLLLIVPLLIRLLDLVVELAVRVKDAFKKD